MKNIQKVKKIKLVLQCSSKKILNIYFLFLKRCFLKVKYTLKSLRLPCRMRKITLLKSPHVNKKAKEHFCSLKHKLILEIPYNGNQNLLLKYVLMNKPKSILFKFIF